jgi:hypothetical protein
VSVDIAYYRREQKHFTATDNRAISPADFSEVCVNAPNDGRLPQPGAQICGNYQLSAVAAARPADNFVTFNDASRKHTEVWSGVDLAMTARLGTAESPTYVSGGVSTGHTAYSNCGVIDNPGQFTATLNVIGAITTNYCAFTTNFLTQVKIAAVHTFLKGIQVSATFQNNPGPLVRATQNVTGLVGYASYPIDLIKPGSQYGDRLNQLDLRFAKSFKVASRTRIKGMVDIYNTLNANPVVALNTTYGANWLKPTQILVGRFVKVGAQLDF